MLLFHDARVGGARIRRRILLALGLAALAGSPAAAWVDLSDLHRDRPDFPDGVHVLDGSYVMNVGELQINITNHGLIGSQFSTLSSFSEAPSAQWPAGSGNEYLWAAGLWIGGVVRGERRVSTGQYERELRPLPELEATVYEAAEGYILRPPGRDGRRGRRYPEPGPDDDGDYRVDEETLDGYDNDLDGRIDEDFGQIGTQMMVCTMYDNTPLSREIYPDHRPLDLKIVQKAYSWEGERFRNFVGFEFEITNVGTVEIEDLYVGFFADCDIGSRDRGSQGEDDLVGFFEGLVRASDGTFSPVTVGYMYDGAAVDPLPGYFGILFLGTANSPFVRIRSYQNFAGLRPYEFGGDPENDEGRYELLSSRRRDPNAEPGDENDYRFLVSVGPWPRLRPRQTIGFQAAMVVGDGLEGMLLSCADALATWRGAFFNLDGQWWTGRRGRETLLCFPGIPPPGSAIYLSTADFMDESCVPESVVRRTIRATDFELQHDGSACIWVNMDDCEECDRLAGRHCTLDNNLFAVHWNCNQTNLLPQERLGCTGIAGAETRISWLNTRLAPPSPGLRVVAGDNSVHVYWDDSSEHAVDLEMLVPDFESYRIWRADNWDRPSGTSLENGPETGLWQAIAEFDRESYFQEHRPGSDGLVFGDTLALGGNTGFGEIAYRPVCLDDPRFDGLAEAMRMVVDRDSLGVYQAIPPLRDFNGQPVLGLEELLPWEGFPAVLDTFFLVTGREAGPGGVPPEKPARNFYEYVDREVKNGFLYFYSVTATDHRMVFSEGQQRILGPGLSGTPSSSFTYAIPGTRAQTIDERETFGPNIFVYPNPVSRSALADFQQMHPNAADPTGQRLMFANLPLAHNRIGIYTLDGDLVQEIVHDGTSGQGEISWNLVSRNGQEVVAGIYLFVVRSDDPRFDDFVGKFAVVR